MCSNQSPLAAWRGSRLEVSQDGFTGQAVIFLAFALIVFGIGHFQVLTFIASLVPGWIPWHRFWTVFFGVAFISAGVSFATGYLQRWAALGVGLMFALWTVTIHLPALLNLLRTPGATQDPDKWSDVFIVVALWGGSWALARGLRDRRDLSSGRFESLTGMKTHDDMTTENRPRLTLALDGGGLSLSR
jgi:putative oxidoreductase